MEATTATQSSSSSSSTTTTTIPQEDDVSSLAHVATPVGQLASPSTHPLVSALLAASVLSVLYLPRRVLSLLLSPALASALLLLATLLYFGSLSRRDHLETRSPELRKPLFHCPEDDQQLPRQEQHHLKPFPLPATTPDDAEPNPLSAVLRSATQKPLFLPEQRHFVEWPRWGPLAVIYEEYEEDEEEEHIGHSPGWPARRESPGMEVLERAALRCYSDDSDDDSASDSVGGSSPAWDLPEDLFFKLDLEEEGLIEIVPLEEDNLIEIDISPCR